MSQQFLRRSKDRRLGLDPNSFSVVRWTDVWDSSRLGLESIVSASVDGQTSGNRVNSFGHILCEEDPCLTVLGTRELTHPRRMCAMEDCTNFSDVGRYVGHINWWCAGD